MSVPGRRLPPTFLLQASLVAVPRIRCPEHGVITVRWPGLLRRALKIQDLLCRAFTHDSPVRYMAWHIGHQVGSNIQWPGTADRIHPVLCDRFGKTHQCQARTDQAHGRDTETHDKGYPIFSFVLHSIVSLSSKSSSHASHASVNAT